MKIFIFFLLLIFLSRISYAEENIDVINCAASLRHYNSLFQDSGIKYNSEYFNSLEGIALSGANNDDVRKYQNALDDFPSGSIEGLHKCYDLGVPRYDGYIIISTYGRLIPDDPKEIFIQCGVGLNMAISALAYNHGSKTWQKRAEAKDFLLGSIHHSLSQLFPKYGISVSDLIQKINNSLASQLEYLDKSEASEKKMMGLYTDNISKCRYFGINYKSFQKGLE